MPPRAKQLPRDRTVKPVPSSSRRLLPFLAAGAAVLLIVLGLLLLRRPGAPAGASDIPILATNMPRLAVDQKTMDFGKVPLDIPVKATFKLTNVGDQPLQILNKPIVEVRQGC
jgi:hypothetical protein